MTMADNLTAQMSNASIRWVEAYKLSCLWLTNNCRDSNNNDDDWKDKLKIPAKDSRTQTEVKSFHKPINIEFLS